MDEAMNELRRLTRMSEADFDSLKNGSSVFFILTPDRVNPHFFLHYVISREIAFLSNVGADVRVLILDSSARTLNNDLGTADIATFTNHLRDITRLVGGKMPDSGLMLESRVIDERKMTSNVLKLLYSLSMDEIQVMPRTNYGLGNGFFDAAAIASLPEDQSVDFVMIGDHEKIAEYLIEKKLRGLSDRKIKLIHGRSIYMARDEKRFPYGLTDEELFMTDRESVLAQKLDLMTPQDVETAIEPFLLNFVDDCLARRLLTKGNYLAWRHIKRCNPTEIRRIFLEYISHFSQCYASASSESKDHVRIVDLTSEGSSDIFAALSNKLRVAILLELETRPLSLSEIFLAVKKSTKNDRLTAAHIFPHLKKLVHAGLVKKENGKYIVAFHNMNLFIQ